MTRVAVGIMVLLTATVPAGAPASARPRPAAGAREWAATPSPGVPGLAEHRYRIIGKLRLGLFWISRDDVGSARMTWRSDGLTSVLSLLVGSDPNRAPRSLNQWGYLREEVRPADYADVFSLRSLDEDDLTPDMAFGLGDGPMFGISCASIEALDVNSAQATVKARGVTYRMFNQLLDRVADASPWKERHTRRPAGADAGFLTALQHAIGQVPQRPVKGLKSPPPVTYVYNNTLYDLGVRGSQALGRTKVGARTFEQLTRTDLAIHNRTTGDVTKFGVTHTADSPGASLPVQILYQPNFWLSVELRLDDEADVPADPESDATVLTRIRAICSGGSPQNR